MSEKAREYLSTDSDWTFELLEVYDREIARIAKLYKLDTYPNQIEIISAEQMMDAYSSVGMPIGYNHWSYKRVISAARWDWLMKLSLTPTPALLT